MNKWGLSMMMLAALSLAACGADDKKDEAKEPEKTEQTAEKETTTKTETEETTPAATDMTDDEIYAKLEEPTEDTRCEVCDMQVYVKDHEMGIFSAQSIKADGSNAFYDDIGCLLNAEIMNEEENHKFVRDFNTKEWVKVDDATIVKTDLKSPMNWGYVSFATSEDADKYIAEHEGAAVTPLADIQAEAKERYEKMKAKKDGEGHDMHGEEGHDHDMHSEEESHDNMEEDHSGHGH